MEKEESRGEALLVRTEPSGQLQTDVIPIILPKKLDTFVDKTGCRLRSHDFGGNKCMGKSAI